MNIKFGTYRIVDEGKMIKDSKRSHYWILYVNDSRWDVIAKESFVSKKFRFYVQKKMISQFKTKEEEKKKGFDFQAEGIYFHVRKTSMNGFTLYVNNTMFKEGVVQ